MVKLPKEGKKKREVAHTQSTLPASSWLSADSGFRNLPGLRSMPRTLYIWPNAHNLKAIWRRRKTQLLFVSLVPGWDSRFEEHELA